ncbi:MAG: 50S ribosomal protein L19e [Candidatus Diapherotrites archaeon]
MQLNKIRRMSSQILKTGKNKIWFEPDSGDKIKEAMTKDDVRELIRQGLIKERKEQMHSKAGARALKEKKRKGRKRGFGKRTGSRKARVKEKTGWIKRVRAQRKKLKELKSKGTVSPKDYRKLYKMIKGNYFKGKKYIELAVKEKKKGK